MKLKYAVLPAAVAMLFSAASMADPAGSITFNGTVKAPTCEIDGIKDLTVELGDHDVNFFQKVGKYTKAGDKVDIKLKGCTGNTANLRINATNPMSKFNIKLDQGADSATGLAIVLKRFDQENGSEMAVDGSLGYTTSLTAISHEGLFRLYPYLVQTEKYVTAGKISATATYNITYK